MGTRGSQDYTPPEIAKPAPGQRIGMPERMERARQRGLRKGLDPRFVEEMCYRHPSRRRRARRGSAMLRTGRSKQVSFHGLKLPPGVGPKARKRKGTAR